MRKRLLIILLFGFSLYVPKEERVYKSFLPLVSGSKTITKGIGATYSQCDYMTLLDGVGWYYNWSANPQACYGVEAIPMIWGKNYVGFSLGGNSDWLMGFNEPDLEFQANLSPREAATLWKQIESLYPERRLVSPSVLSLSWLTSWYDEYQSIYGSPPRIDAVGIHCYAIQNPTSQCKRKVRGAIQWANERSIPEVWVTEYAHLPCLEEGVRGSIDFMQAMREYFDEEPMVTRDAWFQLSYKGDEPWGWGPYCNTSLVDFYSGELTEIGKAY